MASIEEKIHEASVYLLEHIGLKVVHPDALQVFKDHGVRTEGNVAYLTENQLMDALSTLPSTCAVSAVDDAFSCEFGSGKV